MWQVYFYVAVERERQRQRELERRRLLADAAHTANRGRRIDAVARAAGATLAITTGAIASVLDRSLIGPHHA
ncbi:MAG TPA: hypothetical protein VEY67_05590 [Candidatus Dormibacteraeota bacterium]|nr:hypothetical protein [Candidatus Dormibacteraeota bacterium]